IIIVSYNTKTLLAKCLDSLRAAIAVEKEIFVVDNCSSDGSAAMVKELYPEVRLIANSANRGFGAANNQPLADCRGDYVLYLNPDTEVAAGAIAAAVSYMRAHSQTGLAGARITNPDGSLQESVSYRYPNEKYAGRETASLAGKIACVLGAFMIARKDIIDELKGFDEDFFLYGEDEDLCWRIRDKGFSIGFIADATVLHWGGQSEIATPPVAVFAKKLQAEYLFYKKHYLPETISRIKRAQKIKACYRLATLNLLSPFIRNKDRLKNKIECYRLISRMADS
ncbi:MAG TPA: glycosyltransferase family 2 protein, partial [Smithellaceae bacterium]|nr:glycosyltransferase family 2 protein [Smithellaceae bacterium]